MRVDGRRRVEAILSAALRLFQERGVHAVTMTEIAAAADTQVGSLYRFFPTKDSIAEVLLERTMVEIEREIAIMQGRAGKLLPDQLADALVDLMLAVQNDRESALMLIDASSEADGKREKLRERMQRAAANVILAVVPHLPRARVEIVSRTLLYLSRMVVAASDDEARGISGVLAEVRELAKFLISQQLDLACIPERPALAKDSVRSSVTKP